MTHLAISYLELRGVDLLILDESATDEGGFLEYYASRLQILPGGFDEESIAPGLPVPRTGHRDCADGRPEMVHHRRAQCKIPECRGIQLRRLGILTGGALLTLLLSIYLLRTRLSIKERTMMNQLLKDREELFWQMTETVDDVFWAVSADGSSLPLYISPTFETIWGVTL